MEIGFEGRAISHEGQLEISKYSNMEGRGIDGLKVIRPRDKEKLLVTLDDGVLLVFNYYSASLLKIKELGFSLDSLI